MTALAWAVFDDEGPFLEDDEDFDAEGHDSGVDTLDEPGTEVRPALEDDEAYGGAEPEPEEPYEEESEDDLWFEKGPPKDFDFD